MPDLTLTDSTVWVGFFRGNRAACQRLDPLLADDAVRINGPIFAEIVSGARDVAAQNEMKMLLLDVRWLRPAEPIWQRVADTRFALARLGQTCEILDVMIALTAADWGVKLLTRDRDFQRIARVLPLDLEVF